MTRRNDDSRSFVKRSASLLMVLKVRSVLRLLRCSSLGASEPPMPRPTAM